MNIPYTGDGVALESEVASPIVPSTGSETEQSDLVRWLEHAAHLLPTQGPITVFVHHNTLHAFEDLPFTSAVEHAQGVYGCSPYMSEAAYRACLVSGRIRSADIASVLEQNPSDEPSRFTLPSGSLSDMRRAMLEHELRSGSDAEIHWLLIETDMLTRFHSEASPPTRSRTIAETRRWIMRDLEAETDGFAPHVKATLDTLARRYGASSKWNDESWEAATLELLWSISRNGASNSALVSGSSGSRRPDLLELIGNLTDQDVEQLTNELLVRFSLAFLDQGFANWPLPDRNSGYFKAFSALHRTEPKRAGWTKELAGELGRIERAGLGPLESLQESLDLLGVAPADREGFITRSLLGLRGIAGMLWQMETNAEWTVSPAPPGTLLEYLAIRLVLQRVAIRHFAASYLEEDADLSTLATRLAATPPSPATSSIQQRAFTIFQLAQLLGWTPACLAALSEQDWLALSEQIESFSSLERRRIYQLAYERNYRNKTLDAVSVHCTRVSNAPENVAPAFQLVTCIDEREESLRRHLEEADPECETFGVAGFYGVAMYYRGATEAHYRPLCPVNVTPRHFIDEETAYSFGDSSQRRARVRHRLGTLAHQVHVGTRTMVGGVLTGLLGSLATLPLVLRVLSPRSVAIARRLLGSLVTPQATRLRLERDDSQPYSETAASSKLRGYSVDEMADIVEGILRAIGLISSFSDLVVIVGHGSSSLNNPHEAAHDCGACGGGRGGPNARAFAEMANDPRVRNILASRGLVIPSRVSFLGAYHNTCDDSVTYYDLDRLPVPIRGCFQRARRALDEARTRDAHERCRRFESASLALTPEQALEHVETRSEDLSQTRPEYGHASNALCFVGRRSWSRGLFLDRRAFLTSYEPEQDDANSSILARTLSAVIPVCAGINLEYYFSFVDPRGYGCGTKLPHNISSLLGVMDGAASDLRPGLPWQMVEIHEPVRILFLIECTPGALQGILDSNKDLARLAHNDWVQLATLDPDTAAIHVLSGGQFKPHLVEDDSLATAPSSLAWYRGQRDHLGFASIEPTEETAPSRRDR